MGHHSAASDASPHALPMQPSRPQARVDMGSLTIWEAIGSPPRQRIISSNRAPLWVNAASLLYKRFAAVGIFHRCRTWQSLWRLLHSGPVPRGKTMGQAVRKRPAD
eukprot:9260098-Heterocapsa_arctica.AAC.1